MTISFKVCQVEEKNVDMKFIKPFNIRDFIENEIKCSIKKEEYYSYRLINKYVEQGIDGETAYKLAKEEADKLNNEKKELIKSKADNTKVLKSSFKNKSDDNNDDDNNNDDDDYITSYYNSFVYSAWLAYNQHHHLEIRPENIWMAIITQFSFYVSKNSELLRERFVDFQGKQTLVVVTGYPILEAPFDKLTLDMTKQIEKNIKDPSIKDWVIPNFSTTTESDKVIFSVALMSTMKKYFDYKMKSECGLPGVTLHGTVSDWISLKEKVQRLTEFENSEGHMGKWVAYLLPVIDNFIQSVSGTPDVDWWNKIIDIHSQSGGSVITGWLSVFCVFNDDGEYQDNVHHILGKIPGIWPKVCQNSITNGYVSVPVLLEDFDGTQYKSQLYAGHFTSKIKKTKLTPSLNWFIVSNLFVEQ